MTKKRKTDTRQAAGVTAAAPARAETAASRTTDQAVTNVARSVEDPNVVAAHRKERDISVMQAAANERLT